MITVYEVETDNKSASKYTNEKPEKGKVLSVRRFKTEKSYAYFYFKNNTSISELRSPDYDMSKDLVV